MQPNKDALSLFNSVAFQAKVRNEAVECTELAQDLQEASGNVGGQITINPPPGAKKVSFPALTEPARANHHTVYTDGEFVFDPRGSANPIPRAEWEARIRSLNGEAISFELLPAEGQEGLS